jgi:hypothetical protein
MLKNKLKWAGFLAVFGFLSLTSGTASATPITFDFTNVGSISNIASCGMGCSTFNTSGDLLVGGVDVGSFAGTLKVVSIGLGIAGVADTSTWTFLDSSGSNSLMGTLSGDLLGLLKLAGGGALSYDVNGGSGVFTGATGSGSSVFGFYGSSYVETGRMTVNTVPEPAANAMMLAALGMLGYMAWRRRREATQV